MDKLALFGGPPTRTNPFLTTAVVDDDEWKLVKEVLETREFSRFMGAADGDIHELLQTPSRQAIDKGSQYFSFLGGRMVRRFESDFAQMFGVDYAVSVNSATSGLAVALGAADIGPGDEVVTTCMSFNATALSILFFNAIPVFVDVSPKNFCLDPKEVARAITKKTKAILVVHLLGFYADMDEIMKIAGRHDLTVIEDCAQAPGTLCNGKQVGTIGDMGVFSFQETKNVMTGEGGMIISNNSKYARKCRLIRNHGELVTDSTWSDDDLVNIVGMNFRMTELTAALGVAQLGKLEENNRRRVENTRYLQDRLKEVENLQIFPFPQGCVPHIVPFFYDEKAAGVSRDKIIKALRAEGIPVGSGYQKLMPGNPIFQRKIAYGKNQCPWSCHLSTGQQDYSLERFPVAAEMIERRFIWFYHIHAPHTYQDMDDVASAFHKVFGSLNALNDGNFTATKMTYKW